MKVILDTHTLLWWLLESDKLSQRATALLSSASTTVYVSAVSGHEISTKYRTGKLSVPIQLAERLEDVAVGCGWQLLPLTVSHGQKAGLLPGTHRDPFDRMLAAQSLMEHAPLVTNDAAITSFGVDVIW